VKQLEAVLDQFRELFLRERINAIQVKQFESTVYQQQQSLLVARNGYLNSLDNFKQLLGLPPDLDVVIEDPFLDRFELIDDQLNNRLDEVAKLRNDAGLILSDLSTAFLPELKRFRKSWASVSVWPRQCLKKIRRYWSRT